MKELSKSYNPKEVEDIIYQKWEDSGFFNPDNLENASDRFWNAEVFSMSMPPPNITAELHLGHAMFLAIQDLMTRHARMTGKKTLWLPGTDHAAIATNYVVEREIWQTEKKTRHDIGREEFLRKVEKFIAKTQGKIQIQIRKMGASCDWSREKYTFSPELTFAVRTVFKKMFDAGLVYQGNRIVNWCPRCGTTLADDEVDYKTVPGKLYHIHYPLRDGKEFLTVVTTRPETMLADTAVAVHPEDQRYKKYVGKKVMLPLVHRELPVIADNYVDSSFGTGVLKVTPGHDPHDFEIGERNNLDIISLFNLKGEIDEKAAEDYGFESFAGLTVDDARKKIVEELQNSGFLENIENVEHNVGACYRCATTVEPIVSKQWFVNVNSKFKIQNPNFQKQLGIAKEASLKEVAIAAVKSGAIKIVPERFGKVYLHWMENLHDWNISRQIWFGHRIPVWYCKEAGKDVAVTKMGFHESVVNQLFEGKTKTYRLRDHRFYPGQRVMFENSQTGELLGEGKIADIEKTTVGKIDLKDPAHGATYEKREELIDRLKLHNPGNEVNDDTQVFIYTYTFTPLNQINLSGCGETIVSVEPPTVCPACKGTNLVQDPDTLDTWFSSSLWTFSTLGWPNATSDLSTFHPTTIMETGYDILFFWVARMVLMTGFTLETIPFKTVYLNGLVRDFGGKKMSKTAGNGIDPLEMIKLYGTDALRLSLIMGTTPGNDIKIYPEKIAGYRNFSNKLWNISRYILGQVPEVKTDTPQPQSVMLADQWILSELENLIIEINKNFHDYQYGLAAEQLASFTWDKFADWYLEISKLKILNSKAEEVLQYVLTTLLKLWHPFIPFITEHIWSQFSENLLMVQEYPMANSKVKGQKSKVEEQFKQLQELISGLRNLRTEYHEPPAKILASYMELPEILAWSEDQALIVERLARVKLNFADVPADKKMPYFFWRGVKVYLIIPDFDAEKELVLAKKNLQKAQEMRKKLQIQLSKKDFLKKAPPEIIENMKQDYESVKSREEKLEAKIKALK